MSQSENSSRIARNTLILYMRMLVSMLIMFYTSRLVLNTLGVEDYGIYNVVGGMVTLFSCLNASMVSATQRYLTFEIGKEDQFGVNSVFSCSLLIHIIIGIGIIVVSEPIGLWFIAHKMVIPVERLHAAYWVFHLSVFTLFLDLLYIPYSALVISYERMKAFSYISIINVVLKLAVALLLAYSPVEKLVYYAWLMALVSLITGMIYGIYCWRKIEASRFHCSALRMDLLKRFMIFANYSFIGDLAMVCYTQGSNILLNLFFGPAVNAARGISVQVQGAIASFSGNFQMALAPQITKSYAQGDFSYLGQLVCKGSKYSFYLLFLFSFPVMLETHWLLEKWLGIVPEYSVAFVRLMLCISILMAMANPITRAVHSTGNIRSYQLFVGGGNLLVLPLSYGVLTMGADPESVYFIALFLFVVVYLVRLRILKKIVGVYYRTYFHEVVFPILKVLLCSTPFAILCVILSPEGGFRVIFMGLIFVIIYTISVYYVGMSHEEHLYLKNKIK